MIEECQSGPCITAIGEALRKPADSLDSYQESALCGLDENGNCARCGSDLMQYNDDFVYKLDTKKKRCITIVYECQSCRNALFEEDHWFECVEPDTCPADCNFVQDTQA